MRGFHERPGVESDAGDQRADEGETGEGKREERKKRPATGART